MENELMKKQANEVGTRTIDDVTNEIREISSFASRVMLQAAVEIGRRLEEAKGMLAHGAWSEWLEKEVNFSHSTANNYMRLFDEYGASQITIFGADLKSQTLGNLSYTQALKLLAIPSDEREQFVEENNIEELSTRELDKLIKERDEALKKAERAEELEREIAEAEEKRLEAENASKEYYADIESKQTEIEKLNDELQKIKDREKKTKEKLKDLKENPTVSDEVLERIKKEAEDSANEKAKAEIEKRLEDANKKIEEMRKDKADAEAQAIASERKAEELRKQVEMADGKVTEFKLIYSQVQEQLNKLIDIHEGLTGETKDKLAMAINALLDNYKR